MFPPPFRRPALLFLLATTLLGAAPPVERAAPRGRASLTLGTTTITIDYGRPAMRGRRIFGALVPFGRIWRSGTDEATKLSSDGDLLLGTLELEAGRYALFTVPGERAWELIVNRVADQWGAFNYDPAQDRGRAGMRIEALDEPVEQLTITLQAAGLREGILRIEWEKTAASVPVRIAAGE